MPSAQYTPSLHGSTPRLDPTTAQWAQSAQADFVAAGHPAANSFARAQRHSTPDAPYSILAIRPGALGDALLAWPALALLRRLAPKTRLHLVTRAEVMPLALSSGLADAATAYDDPRWLGLFAPTLPLPPEAVDADVVVAWLGDPDGEVAARLRAICSGRVLVIPGRPDLTVGEHAALQLLRPLAALGLPVPAPGTPPAEVRSVLPPLDAGDLAREVVARWWEAQSLDDGAAPVVALHAGSGGAAKRWPAARYGILAAELARSGVRPLLISGPQDAGVSAAVQASANAARLADLPEAQGLAIAEVAALLQRCAAFVGNDSGVAHLAGLLGIPTLALFGPTDPSIWAPLGGQVLCAPDGDMTNLGLADVLVAVHSLLGEQSKLPSL